MHLTTQHEGAEWVHIAKESTGFDLRWNNRIALGVDDNMPTAAALKGIGGKRLMYDSPHYIETKT
jgi:hypothetical protein